MNFPRTYSDQEYNDGVKRESVKLVKEAINWVIGANNIKEKTPEWYRLMEVKTYVEQPRK